MQAYLQAAAAHFHQQGSLTDPNDLAGAAKLAGWYGHADSIPLCNPLELPEKLARVAVAYAALCHSSDANHEKIIVTDKHVIESTLLMNRLFKSRELDFLGYAQHAGGLTAVSKDELEVLSKWVQARMQQDTVLRPGAKKKSTTRKLLRHFLQQPTATRSELVQVLSLTPAAITKKLKPYFDKDLLEAVGGKYRRTQRFLTLLKHLRDRGAL
jgi:hypothetical protein